MDAEKKRVWLVIPHMVGGGAERVAAMLLNTFYSRGYDAAFIVTGSKRSEIIYRDLDAHIPLIVLQEHCSTAKHPIKRALASALSHLYEDRGKPVPAKIAHFSFTALYHNEIKALRKMLSEDPEATVIAFCQPAIPITLLAARGLKNKIIISERTDPIRLMGKRYGRPFIERYYDRADAAVFQTDDAKNTYPPCVSQKGLVIPNPIKSDLPAPYLGQRNRNITTFCRISAQKNLPVLLEAFRMLHNEYPEYMLRIIGDAGNDEEAAIKAELVKYIKAHGLENAVRFEPFNANVHEAILQDAMYVNSSDFEGISNAMLESMAIGLPVICTDCPIGGAKATIRDGENGLLVPVGDSGAIYQAMKKLIENPALSKKIAEHSSAVRASLSLSAIADKWMQLL